MREPNYSFPSQNRAAIVISTTLYDRRALDSTATLPLVNSLTHLVYLTSTSSRIREILATDGGLERIIKILVTCRHSDRHSLWKWTMGFQCLVNVGVRGTEAIRSHVVEVGGVHVVLDVLENYLRALEQTRLERDQERGYALFGTLSYPDPTPAILPLQQQQQTPPPPPPVYPATDTYRRALNHSSAHSADSRPNTSEHQPSPPPARPSFAIPRRRTFLTRIRKPKSTPPAPDMTSIPFLTSFSPDVILHREEDVLLSLQLLAYLSKYPHIREILHNNSRRNVFTVAEKFTHRSYPPTIMYWAGVIMRNACRKDDSKGGLRQCAYMHCGKWERYTREFAKCRRCRKAKYCSKDCQSKAWSEGHRWWCVERHPSHPPSAPTTNAMAVMATATNVPQAIQPGPVLQLNVHNNVLNVPPIPINDRPGELDTVESDAVMQDNTDSDTPGHLHVSPMTRHHSDNNHTPAQANRVSFLNPHAIHRRRPRSPFAPNVPPSGSSTDVETDVAGGTADDFLDLMDID